MRRVVGENVQSAVTVGAARATEDRHHLLEERRAVWWGGRCLCCGAGLRSGGGRNIWPHYVGTQRVKPAELDPDAKFGADGATREVQLIGHACRVARYV